MPEWRQWAALGPYQTRVDAALQGLAAQNVMARIWARDHTVWKPEPRDITNRLGWLDLPLRMRGHVAEWQAFVEALRADGYAQALLLGMGGSSLSPELYARVFERRAASEARACLNLEVLDSTDPGAVLAQAERLDPARTLFIVSTKSGGTVETFSLFKYFYSWTVAALGQEHAGEHFVAITDPGSDLAKTAERLRFRATFLSEPTVGGRYSAFSPFGLVPAALCGVDLERLLERAVAAMEECGPRVPVQENPGAWLGAVLGELAKAGRDKVTFVVPPETASLSDWAEQLIAESTGKEGRGILPVVGEPLAAPEQYGEDRVFVHVRLDGSAEPAEQTGRLEALNAAGHPVVHVALRDVYDLGRQFYLWEVATAVAGHCLGINPFDQPNVEAAKVRAREMMAAYARSGALPSEQPTATGDGMAVYGLTAGQTPADALGDFLAQSRPGDYIALQVYVQPAAPLDAALQRLRVRLRERYRLATTVGHGPRFLHSTGQLHKGDAGRGLFIQLTADDSQDAPIPDEAGSPASSMTFGVLKAAQALGDWKALLDAGRRAIRFHLGQDVPGGLRYLTERLG